MESTNFKSGKGDIAVNEFRSEKEMENLFLKKKNELICAGKSAFMSLDRDDRYLLRVFLGYENGLGLNRPHCKDKKTAPVYVRETLFDPDKLLDGHEETIKTEICERTKHGKLETIFPIFQGKWFEEGMTFSDAEACACVRSFQAFNRSFMTDLSFKRLKPATRMFIAGPVSIAFYTERERERETKKEIERKKEKK